MPRNLRPIRTVLALFSVYIAYLGIHQLMLIGSCSTPVGPGETPCPPGSEAYFFMTFFGCAGTIVMLMLGAHPVSFLALFVALGGAGVSAGLESHSGGAVFFGVTFLLGPLLMVLSTVSVGLRRLRAARLLRDGVHALGTVTAVEDTKVRINGRPRLRLTLRIEADAVLPPYESTRTFTAGAIEVPRIGDRYEVWVDPDDRDQWMFAPHGAAQQALAGNALPSLRQLVAIGRSGRQPALPPPLSAQVIEELGRLNADRLEGRISAEEFNRRYAQLVTS